MFRAIAVAALLSLSAQAHAQHVDDPYAKDYFPRLVAEYQGFEHIASGVVRMAAFAMQCRVLSLSAEGNLFSSLQRDLERMFLRLYETAALNHVQSPVTPDHNLNVLMDARRAGWGRAARGCQWWHDHPDDVAMMRDLARDR